MTADWAPKLEDNTCAPGSSSSARSTRCCAERCSKDWLMLASPARSCFEGSAANHWTSFAVKPTLALAAVRLLPRSTDATLAIGHSFSRKRNERITPGDIASDPGRAAG